jgi:hypothetical protein
MQHAETERKAQEYRNQIGQQEEKWKELFGEESVEIFKQKFVSRMGMAGHYARLFYPLAIQALEKHDGNFALAIREAQNEQDGQSAVA